jgi:hypothetical protein
MDSASVVLCSWVNALKGTEPDGVELTVVLGEEEAELLVVPTPEVSAFAGVASTPEEGVYGAEVVVALEPADEEPEAA